MGRENDQHEGQISATVLVRTGLFQERSQFSMKVCQMDFRFLFD
jgi:hypothetical protein